MAVGEGVADGVDVGMSVGRTVLEAVIAAVGVNVSAIESSDGDGRLHAVIKNRSMTIRILVGLYIINL